MIMGLTHEQEQCVNTLEGSIVVAAGAGSGKTFTLTERIVHAFEEEYVTDIDEVCAITFTKKAAGELKSRIKAGLKANDFPEQALKVDDAWISTIHGMCARILRANAVELGIDPAFTIAEGAQLDALLAQAVEEVLVEASASGSSERLDRLFSAWQARSMSAYDESVESMITTLVTKASANARGSASFILPGASMPAAIAVGKAIDIVSGLVEDALAASSSASCLAWTGVMEDLLADARSALENGIESYEDALALIAPLKLSKSFGSKAFKQLVDEAKIDLAACIMEVRMGLAREYLETLVNLAERTLDVFTELKRAQGVLDNNDLLVYASRAIEEHPDIASRYSDKFKLIMVDEFQDTDQMQVDMIKRLAGEGSRRLCTVGDAQQSIYRFRGADVSVYRRHVATVGSESPESVMKLTGNFRSHADVLSFVEFVFVQPSMFGREFMSLSAERGADKEDERFSETDSRITVLHTAHPSRGVNTAEARMVAARRIASEFAALRDAGHSAGEMVVLLGTMASANVYADALRREGFACVISGGSVFSDTEEAQIVRDLVRVIANPHETQSLFNVLISPLFALDASDLLAVGGPKRFWEADAETDTLSLRASCAIRVLGEMRSDVGRISVARLIERVAIDSGWLSRLESQGPEGLAAAGNLYKAIRMVAGVERGGAFGPLSVMRRFEETLASSKEAPGSLSVSGGDSVRIMTVHSSKGLEFPIVAVAEFKNEKQDASSLIAADVNGSVYLSLDAPSRLLKNAGNWVGSSERTLLADDMLGPDSDEEELARAVECDAGALHRRLALARYTARGEAEEGKRLLYVALTRAKEALVVSTMGTTSKDNPASVPKSAFAGIHTALGGGDGLAPGRTLVDFGGKNPAVVECTALAVGDSFSDAAETICSSSSSFVVPAPRRQLDVASREVYRPIREGVFSYSSIADASHEGDLLAQLASDYAQGVDGAPDFDEDDNPTLRSHSSEQDARNLGEGCLSQSDSRETASWSEAFLDGSPSDFDVSSSFDQDRATDLGTAFHRLAQYAVVAREGISPLEMPPTNRIEALSRTCNLDTTQRIRLKNALDRWFDSTVAREMSSLAHLAAEVPFFVAVDGAFLEGEIDLLGFDEGRTHAYVVDYKTGGSDDETASELECKHVLQASCYAYAILLQGIEQVDATFVRVERCSNDTPNEPQCVRYRFNAHDIDALAQAIAQAYARCR
jgi:ATP-dependent exoDNAse (exonuclease V) beta subunit